MVKHLSYVAALLGLALVLAPIAEAGDRDGRAVRGNRGGGAPVRSRSTFQPPARPPASTFLRSTPSPRATFPQRTQPSVQRSFGTSRSNGSRVSPWSSGSSPRTLGGRSSLPTPSWRQPSVNVPSATQRVPGLVAPGSRFTPRSSSGDAAVARLRERTTGTRSWSGRGGVAVGGIQPSSRGDTTRSPSVGRTWASPGVSRTPFGSSGSTSARAGQLDRSGSTRSWTTLNRSRPSRFGGASTLVSGGTRTTAAVGGSVRTRPGTRGRVGRSYRIHSHGTYDRSGPAFGFYYAWSPWYSPYYRAYPSYGLYFGYGLTWYGPAYETIFVDATDYYPTQVIVEEHVIVPAPAPQPLPAPEVAPAPAPAPGGFPPPAPQADEEGAPGEEPAVQAHPDFDPAVKDFLGGRYQSALQRLDRVLAAQPDNGEAWLAAMHANFALGQYGRAAAALAKAAALEAFPRGYRFDPRPLYTQTGNFDRAVQALEDHMRRNPQDVDALLVRAYLHVALGERAPAQDLIQKVLQLRPGDSTAPALALALLPPPPPPAPEQR